MATKLLNSGSLKDYQAIGEDGILVWQRADAFRASIANSKLLGVEFANILAQPKFSADSTHVDWFVPFESQRADGEYDVVAWSAATDEERAKAYEYLYSLKSKFMHYGMNLEARALSSNDKLFAHFLIGNRQDDVQLPAIQFPDANCVYIVNNRPVITFWGFLNHNAKVAADPFFKLAPKKIVNSAAHSSVNAATGASAVPPAAPASFFARHKWCLLLGIPLLLLLPFLLYLLWWWLFARSLPLFSAFPDFGNLSLAPKAIANAPLKEDDDEFIKLKNGTSVKLPSADGVVAGSEPLNGETPVSEEATEPQGQESVNEAQSESEQSEEPQSESPAPDSEENTEDNSENQPQEPSDLQNPSDKDDTQAQDPTIPPELSEDGEDAQKEGPLLSNEDLNSGDISKFNGTWNVNSPIVDKNTNRPIKLKYEFKDGKGKAIITQKDGVTCVGDVTGGLNAGAFSITNQSVAKCSNGSSYALPTVKCKNGTDGNSSCVSEYDGSNNSGKSNFPMELHR